MAYPDPFETPYGWLPRREARAVLSEAQNHRCCYCGAAFSDMFPGTIEHLKPLAAGGDNRWTNLVAACGPCNSARGSQDAFDYAGARRDAITAAGLKHAPTPPETGLQASIRREAARQKWLADILAKDRAYRAEIERRRAESILSSDMPAGTIPALPAVDFRLATRRVPLVKPVEANPMAQRCALVFRKGTEPKDYRRPAPPRHEEPSRLTSLADALRKAGLADKAA